MAQQAANGGHLFVRDQDSPFTPGRPVPPEFFVGRGNEVSLLQQKVRRAGSGRLEVAFLTGERGIGKSSLASYLRLLTEEKDQALGIHTFLGGVRTLEEAVRRVLDRLLKEAKDKPWFERLKELFKDSAVRRGDLFGVSLEFRPPAEELASLVEHFPDVLRRLVDRLKEEKKEILLVLDDVNGLAESAEFADWLKSLVDGVATSRRPLPLCLLFVGLEERRQALIRSQPSLARVFDLVDIAPLSQDETQDFYRRAFGGVQIEVDDAALHKLWLWTGGLPVLAHEVGDAVFKANNDTHIDEGDVDRGIVAAAEIVGRKYLQPQVFQAIRSSHYRAILRKLATAPPETRLGLRFQRKDLVRYLDPEERSVVDNFLRKMRQLDVIRTDPEGGPGAYRFVNMLHAFYIWMEAKGPAKA